MTIGRPSRSAIGVARIRAEYVDHIARTFELLGRDAKSARTSAEQVMAFETALAKASRKLEDLRDPEKNYNKLAPAELTAKYTPSIDWSARLAAWGLDPGYVLAGQRMQWEIPLSPQLRAGGGSLKVRFNDDPNDQTLPLETPGS